MSTSIKHFEKGGTPIFCSLKEILNHAQEQRYCVPAFNCFDFNTTAAVIQRCEILHSPVIIGAQERGLRYTGIEAFAGFVCQLAARVKVPVALHLDHGTSTELVEGCLKAGFSGALLNTAHLPIGENIEKTSRLVSLADTYHAGVEGELGLIEGDEDGRNIQSGMKMLTKPGEVRRYLSETGVAALAVSVNTLHFKQDKLIEPDFALIKEIREIAGETPLVLHGGASVDDRLVTELLDAGFVKYNINFEINYAMLNSLKSQLQTLSFKAENGRYHAPTAKIFKKAGDAVGDAVQHWTDLLSSTGKG